ncbi:MAG: TolB family protein, partial [Phototrophicaceae bacterium]
ALADINSSTIQQLTEGTIIRDWSADNNRILFQRAGDIWEYIISENRQINLTAHASVDFGAQWSPDEEYISFISERDGNRELYLLNIQEGSTQRITTTENLAESTDVYWSPDGNWVAFRQWAINPIPGITLYNLQTMAFYDIHISGWGNNWRWVPNSQGLVTIVNDVSAGFPYQYGLYTLQISCVYAENGCVADDLIRVKGIPTLNDLVLDIVPSPVVETNIKPRG